MTNIIRKQSGDNATWLEAMNNIEALVSEKDYRAAEKKAIADIRKVTKGANTAYAYSGGKDSIVLAHLCQKAGITASMMGMCDLEYPAFAQWIQEHKPEGCELINTGQDLSWLAKHQGMLFPQSSAQTGRWFAIVQHRAQEDYFKRHSLDMLILGRRRADGNYTGTEGLYTNGRGITRYSPMYAWRHEMILAGIHYNRLPLPPIYDWKDGFTQGTHPWPARVRMMDHQQGWQEIYDIDPGIVQAAAEHIESAALFLKGGERMKITKLKLTELKRPERNVRMHSDKQIAEFKRSVTQFDQIRPIVVDENYVILAGNGLYETLLALGRETADCLVKTGLSENQKKKLMLADNRIYSLGADDLEAFEAILEELKDDLDIPGFDDELLQSLVADTEQVTELINEYGNLDHEDVQRIQADGQRQEVDLQRAQDAPAEPAHAQEGSSTPVASITCPKCGEVIWL